MENPARVEAVIAALEQVRAHVDAYPADAELEPSAYNRWVRMLDGAIDTDCDDLLLEDFGIEAGEYLMHLDAAIAFPKELLAGSETGLAAQRSISPKTMSRDPRIAETSANMWPRLMKSIAARCGNPGARILQR
jgi:hypothetical protein